jgi:hypothetical protein
MLNTRMSQDVIIGATFACFNVDSVWVVYSDGENQSEVYNKKSFVAYSRDMWKQYPENVRQWYSQYVSKVEERSTSLMVSPGIWHQGTLSC